MVLKRDERRKEEDWSQPQPGTSAMASTAQGKVPGWSLGMWVIRCPHLGRVWAAHTHRQQGEDYGKGPEMTGPHLWPQRPLNLCHARPHLTSLLPRQSMGGMQGLVCPRTGRE